MPDKKFIVNLLSTLHAKGFICSIFTHEVAPAKEKVEFKSNFFSNVNLTVKDMKTKARSATKSVHERLKEDL